MVSHHGFKRERPMGVNKAKIRFRKEMIPYLFIMPWILGFLIFTIGPLLFSLIISFFDWPIVGEPAFVGFGNYIRMFTQDKMFGHSLFITVKFAIIFVPLFMGIALGLDRKSVV